MGFSVVGLPHYTIWHLYEPSVDDIRHMEEMDKEKKEKEAVERARQEQANKLKATFDTPSKQWEGDKATIQDMAKAANEAKAKGKDKEVSRGEEKDEAKAAGGGSQEADKLPAAVKSETPDAKTSSDSDSAKR